ncbi:MAG: ABC transporter permease [Acidobacteriota bacterium]|nr:MAG: ABC transporter permease [Acidobacteriota bacterium]
MSVKTLFENVWGALLFNRRRTIITMISLAWAVASFLILMSYGQGFDVALRQAFRAVGQDIVFMANGQTSEQAGGMRSGRTIRLRKEDVEEIKAVVPHVAAISPEIMSGVTISLGNRQKEYMVRGVWPEYQRIRNMQIVSGRWLTSEDDRFGRRVTVIGATVAREMFGKRSPIGAEITINTVRFTVVGLLETKVQLANYNRPDNECVFIPYETMKMFQSVRYPSNIVWTPTTPVVREKALKQVREVLAGLHRFSPTDDKAVFVLEFSKFVSIIDGMSIALNVLLGFIGLVTLAIGAVGLANIMFTSVLERTKEIGIMKALGARRRTILTQFLLEAVAVVLAGGLVGVLLGYSISSAVGSLPFMGVLLGEELSQSYGRIHFLISAQSVAISFFVLFIVGMIAGILPAIRASKLDPVASLHYE